MEDDKQYKSPIKSRKRILIEYGVCFGVILIITVIIGLMRYFFFYQKQSTFSWVTFFGDIISVGGIFGVLFWALLLVSKGGAFDMIVYGTKKFFFAIFKRDPLSGLPRTYSEYVYEKRLKRGEDRFYYILFTGLFYLLLGVILLIISYQVK